MMTTSLTTYGSAGALLIPFSYVECNFFGCLSN